MNIKFFFTDVDGTLTDGCTYYSNEGEALKKFSHIDGAGFYLLKQLGIEAGIITGENSDIVTRRAEKLKIKHIVLGCKNKLEYIQEFVAANNCTLAEVAYIGDDLNDFELISHVGISFAPANASNIIKNKAHHICTSKGGEGAFREAVEILIEKMGLSVTEVFYKTK